MFKSHELNLNICVCKLKDLIFSIIFPNDESLVGGNNQFEPRRLSRPLSHSWRWQPRIIWRAEAFSSSRFFVQRDREDYSGTAGPVSSCGYYHFAESTTRLFRNLGDQSTPSNICLLRARVLRSRVSFRSSTCNFTRGASSLSLCCNRTNRRRKNFGWYRDYR